MSHALQFILFCAVGVATTIIDFSIYNLLTRPTVGWRRIPANVVSVTIAMTWSFLANWLIVFQPPDQDWLVRAGRFLVTTAFSAFVLQNVVLHLTHIWHAPVHTALWTARRLGLDRGLDEHIIARNTCKVLAVSVGLIWNYCWYKFFVYK